MIINNKADLNALRGTDAYAEALRRILGATTMWVNDAPAGQPAVWHQESVGEVLAQFDLTTEELLEECAAAGVVPQTPEQPLPAKTISSAPSAASKLGLKRALSEIGLWGAAKAAIASDPDAQEEWDLALSISRDDPLARKVIAGLALTDDQLSALLTRADELTR